MDVLGFAEKQGQEATRFSLATLEIARARCHQLLVLLLGGAGALAGIGISQWGSGRFIVCVVAGMVALWWFCIAAWVAVRGLRSSPVRSWANQGTTVLELENEWRQYAKEVSQEGGAEVDVLYELRHSALRVAAAAAEEYRTASTYAAHALDNAYTACALTPVPLMAAVWVAYRWG